MDDIDRANEQAQYLLDMALQRTRRVASTRPSADFARIVTTLSHCFVSRRSRVVRPALVARSCGSCVDE